MTVELGDVLLGNVEVRPIGVGYTSVANDWHGLSPEDGVALAQLVSSAMIQPVTGYYSRPMNQKLRRTSSRAYNMEYLVVACPICDAEVGRSCMRNRPRRSIPPHSARKKLALSTHSTGEL